MSLKTLTGTLAAAVANGGTVAVTYPTGYTRGDFIPGVNHRLVMNQVELQAPDKIGMSFGASSVTITNNTGAAWPAGSPYILQLEIPGTEVGQLGVDGKTRMLRVLPLPVRLLDLGSPLALAAAGLLASASLTSATPPTLITTSLDVPRNITIASAGNDSAMTFTVRGKDVYGNSLTEVITGANAGTANGKKAFSTITSITPSANTASTVTIGWGNVLGLPAYLPNAVHILKEMQDGASATAGTTVAGDQTSPPSGTTGDVRGTYVPNAAPDGTKAYALVVAIPDPGYLGATNYAA